MTEQLVLSRYQCHFPDDFVLAKEAVDCGLFVPNTSIDEAVHTTCPHCLEPVDDPDRVFDETPIECPNCRKFYVVDWDSRELVGLFTVADANYMLWMFWRDYLAQ